jgi:hypothetical protein
MLMSIITLVSILMIVNTSNQFGINIETFVLPILPLTMFLLLLAPSIREYFFTEKNRVRETTS